MTHTLAKERLSFLSQYPCLLWCWSWLCRLICSVEVPVPPPHATRTARLFRSSPVLEGTDQYKTVGHPAVGPWRRDGAPWSVWLCLFIAFVLFLFLLICPSVLPSIPIELNHLIPRGNPSRRALVAQQHETGARHDETSGQTDERSNDTHTNKPTHPHRQTETRRVVPSFSSSFTMSTPDDAETTANDNRDNIPLHDRWVLWYDNPRLAPAGTDWKDNLKNCGTFDNVADFWRIVNNILPASRLALNSNYHIFREGIEPSWEDSRNQHGGKFVLSMPKKDSDRLDDWWTVTLLSVIGETLDASGDGVCGAVVSIRKSQDRIALWTKGSDKKSCVAIGGRWKKILGMHTTPLNFQLHNDGKCGHT